MLDRRLVAGEYRITINLATIATNPIEITVSAS